MRHMTVNARLLLSLAGAMAFALPLASAAGDSPQSEHGAPHYDLKQYDL
jgi:hypothetical protein